MVFPGSSGGLKCYSIVKTVIPTSGIVASQSKNVVQCPPNHKCQLAVTKGHSVTLGIRVDGKDGVILVHFTVWSEF